MKLAQLAKGNIATVVSIDDPALEQQLFEMGMVPGQLIQMQGAAPFGCPLLIRISGYDLSLRQEDANHINVRVD